MEKQSFLTLILIRNGCKIVIDLAYTFTRIFAKNSTQESVEPSFSLRKRVLSHYAHDTMFTQCVENGLNSLQEISKFGTVMVKSRSSI